MSDQARVDFRVDPSRYRHWQLSVDGQVAIKPAGVETPQRGSTMTAVEARFGAPANKSSPVGSPPITKWFYPNFVVVFENDKVLHAVVVAS